MGVVEIVPNASNATLGSDTSQPGLPLVPVNIRVPLGTKLNSVTESISKKVLLTDVDVSDTAQDASVVISTMNGVKMKTVGLAKGRNSTTEDISSCAKGINVVSLLVDGKVVDSSSFVKKVTNIKI